MNFGRFRLPRVERDAKLLIGAVIIYAVSFYGIQILLKVLYILRLGYGPEYVGVFNAIGALTYMSMGLPSGALGNRFGTRKIMLLGGSLTVIGMTLLPLSEFVPLWAQSFWPFFTQVVGIAGWSMFNVNFVPALMATTTEQNRNGAYAVSGALRGLGTFLGTTAGGMLPGLFAGMLGQNLEAPGPYRFGLWVGAAIGLTGLIPLCLVRSEARASSEAHTQKRGGFPVLPIVLMIVYVYFSHGGWATCQGFCSAYLDSALHLPPSAIGLLGGAGQFIAILAPLFIPRLSERFTNGRVLMVCTLGMGICLLPLALIPHWAAAGLGQLGVMVLSAIWLPTLQVYQMEQVSSEWRSLAYGAVSMAMGLGFGSTSLVGGYLVAGSTYRNLFLMGTALSTTGATLMWGIQRRMAKANNSTA